VKRLIPDPSPQAMIRYHFAMMVIWPILLIPTLIWWKESILWIASMSLYANWASHFSGWDAARAGLLASQSQEESEDTDPGQN
jgi:hypothetical protein